MNYPNSSTTINHQVTISDLLKSERREALIAEIFTGLTSHKRYISSRFFYDQVGSALFEEITTLYEYYPSRTEKAILRLIAPELMKNYESIDIIELGSGDCSKISILLNEIPKDNIHNVQYIPVDVSDAAILKSAELLSSNYPALRIHGLRADFIKHLNTLPGNRTRLICFFGSTLGNLSRNESYEFLLNIKTLMRPGDSLLIGFDMVKDVEILEAAYNDKQGVTAAFNKNILNVVNHISETSFDPDLFEHVAFYNSGKARIEMHLRAIQEVAVTSSYFPELIHLKKGEFIHTENSHKYTIRDIMGFGAITGLEVANIFTDAHQWFSLGLYQRVN